MNGANGHVQQPILEWDEEGVKAWLSSLNLSQFGSQIDEHGITGEILVHLDHEALRDIGVHSVGQRLAILKAVYNVKLRDKIPIEDGHWIPPSDQDESAASDDAALFDGLSSPMRVYELISDRDERIVSLEREIVRLGDALQALREEMQQITRTITSNPATSMRPGSSPSKSPTGFQFPQQLSSITRAPQLAGSRVSAHGRSQSTTVPTPPQAVAQRVLTHARASSTANVTTAAIGSSPSGSSALLPLLSSPATTSYSPERILPPLPMSATGPLTPSMGTPTTANSHASSSSSTGAFFSDSARSQSAATSVFSIDQQGQSSRTSVATTAVSPDVQQPLSSSAKSVASSSGSADNPYKSFKVTLEDPCYRVLPAALKKYNINDDWRDYALFICYGSNEKCLSYDDKPLLLFQKLKESGQKPCFLLRHIRDIKSPIAVAAAKHAARMEKRAKDGQTTTSTATAHKDYTRNTRLHHPPVLQPVGRSQVSPGREGSYSEDASISRPAIGYALAIYPYLAEREDELDVAVGDTFAILSKTKGWWVVHRESNSPDVDVTRSAWIPAGCLLETSVSALSLVTSANGASSVINPLSIVSQSTPSIALMDYKSRGNDELSLVKGERLNVYKRYNHFSFAINDATATGMSSGEALKFIKQPAHVGIIGCPFSGGQPKAGVDIGPLQLIEAGLLDDIKGLGYGIVFDGQLEFEHSEADDPPIGILKRPRLVSRVNKTVADTIEANARAGRLTLTLGGDHSLAMATVSGTFRVHPDACLIWIDAHADLNTPLTTESGNLHGCPVSFLLGLEGCDIPEFSWIKPVLKADRLVYIGLRDIDAGERRILREQKIKAYSMHDVDKYGIGRVVEMALDHVNPNRDRPIHLSFDVDALDPSVAPSTGTPVRGGLTFREGHYICEAIAETGLLVSLDIMEVNPSLADKDAVKQTVEVGRSLTRSALGETLL
ncbi:uncharacterized protein L969DRAFT_96656 [Mixia osmundae IAM 14324]|uniref:Arginase n=1 Tax=Mixia osmundae (strain CBS 9802 / IAM 14324 / JCM 22182 / KY 12970) TaxID=764103 RepID=G7DU16_MIXOS|nr:uncharacterized protein L969DRAFT_96656 [Mixia osmundae IAM 14324]KEI37082.1 hypothetical protein L969DRAFT_96656 [Mixia osmundae IAM 14324]GAA94076.1 hypothetical protein E5Q_00723 [Mixia osmundae IAM 14324]